MQQTIRDDREPLLAKRLRSEFDSGQALLGASWFYSSHRAGDSKWQEQQEMEQMKSSPTPNSSKPAFFRLPELIDTLAKDERVLRWDPVHNWFEVVDGPAFEERFNALRCIRGKRREDAVDRPFARMHIHFILARGDKWAGTGSAFRPKGETMCKGQPSVQMSAGTSESFGPKIEQDCNHQNVGLIFEQGVNAVTCATFHPHDPHWKSADSGGDQTVSNRDLFNHSDHRSSQMYDGSSSAWDSIPLTVIIILLQIIL
jgi:hypothetical protein